MPHLDRVPERPLLPRRQVRGRIPRNASTASASNCSVGGSCQGSGPSFAPRASTPEARKLATAPRAFLRRRMCVMYRPPFTEKTNSSGVRSAHIR